MNGKAEDRRAEEPMEIVYPRLNVNLTALRTNAEVLTALLARYGIRAAGVIKVSDGDLKVAEAYSPCAQLAVSRAGHLRALKKAFPGKETMLIRSPMRAEMTEAARFADYILMSEEAGLRALNEAAAAAGTRPGVILMLDIGARREGVVSTADLVALAETVEKELPSLRLRGVGTNLACLNGVLPEWDNLKVLSDAAEAVEAAIGRRLDIVSGGSTVNLRLLTDGNKMPPRINHLRLGGIIANPINFRLNRGIHFEGTREDTFTLEAEIIELKEKDSAVAGSTLNWAGHKVVVEDKGVRLRAIAAVGSQDIADALNLIPLEEGVKVVGGSSDHSVLDVTDCPRSLAVGDVLAFRLRYPAALSAFSTRHVAIRYCQD